MIFNPKVENKIDTTKPPLGPPMRLANCFSFKIKENKKNVELYQEYIKEYRSECDKRRFET